MKKRKISENDRVCGNCIWWDGAYCDNEDDKVTDEFETCKDWADEKNPKYKEDK